MYRLASLLMLALALLSGSGLGVRLGEVACADQHHEEEEGGIPDCPPECATCPCCARLVLPPIALPVPVTEPRPEVVTFHDDGSGLLPAPPPRGILHVPRLMA